MSRRLILRCLIRESLWWRLCELSDVNRRKPCIILYTAKEDLNMNAKYPDCIER